MSISFKTNTEQVVAGIELFQTPGSSQSVTKKIKMVTVEMSLYNYV